MKLTIFEKEFSKLSKENIDGCFGIANNIPDFLIAEFKRSLGRKFKNVMRLLEKRAPISIRVNPLKSDISSILEFLSLEGIEGKKSKRVRYGIDIIGNPRRLTPVCSEFGSTVRLRLLLML